MNAKNRLSVSDGFSTPCRQIVATRRSKVCFVCSNCKENEPRQRACVLRTAQSFGSSNVAIDFKTYSRKGNQPHRLHLSCVLKTLTITVFACLWHSILWSSSICARVKQTNLHKRTHTLTPTTVWARIKQEWSTYFVAWRRCWKPAAFRSTTMCSNYTTQ